MKNFINNNFKEILLGVSLYTTGFYYSKSRQTEKKLDEVCLERDLLKRSLKTRTLRNYDD